MNDDREHNRQAMPETAELVARARRELAAFGPLKLIYAEENGHEIGTAQDVIAEGEIDLSGLRIRTAKIRERIIGGRARRIEQQRRG